MAAWAAVVIIKVFKGLRGDRCRWTVVKLGGPERDRDGSGVRSRSQGGDDRHRRGQNSCGLNPAIESPQYNHFGSGPLSRLALMADLINVWNLAA